MSFATLLINSCQFERWSDLDDSAFGNPTKEWSDQLAVQPCRLSSASGRQRQNDTEVVQVDEVLFVNDIDVTEYDRVTVDGVLYEILFVTDKQDGSGDHHKELDLVRVKA